MWQQCGTVPLSHCRNQFIENLIYDTTLTVAQLCAGGSLGMSVMDAWSWWRPSPSAHSAANFTSSMSGDLRVPFKCTFRAKSPASTCHVGLYLHWIERKWGEPLPLNGTQVGSLQQRQRSLLPAPVQLNTKRKKTTLMHTVRRCCARDLHWAWK